MPALDFVSLSLLTFVSLSLMAMALPFAMGRDAISCAARHSQRYFMLQALGWVCIVIASRLRHTPWDVLFSCLAAVSVAAAQWSMAHALAAWLGPRRGMRWLKLCCFAGPLGFMLLWSSITARFAWFSAIQACGLLLLMQMCMAPHATSPKGWRMVLGSCAAVMAGALLLRAGVIQFRPQWLPHFAAQLPINHGFVILSNICTTLTLVSVLVAWREESHQQLRELALTDMLTGVANRRAFEIEARTLLTQASRRQSPVTLLLLDLDHFKQINDRHGHAVGDQALRLFTATVRSQLREGDLFARWGGEEFCLLVHGSHDAVQALYARLSQAVEQQSRQALGFPLGFSAGAAPQAQTALSLDASLLHADTALYHAKQSGRGKLVFAETAMATNTAAAMVPPSLAPAEAAASHRGHHTAASEPSSQPLA